MEPPSADLTRRLRGIPAFAELSDLALLALLEASPVVEFAAGERMLGQFETGGFALILLSGEASVVNESQHGHALLAVLSAPTLIGEIGALARLKRTAGVMAATPVRALRVERDTLMAICRESPDMLVSMIGELGGRIESINRALGLYAWGFAALERGELDTAILEDLNHPTQEVRHFADAFHRLARHIAVERRKHDEMASAALIQRAMLPHALDTLPLGGRCEVFGDMTPAREVGGDLFDVFMLDDDRLALIIGDVCGKGVPASLFMSVTMTTLRLVARERRSVSATVETANTMLCDQNPSMMFATMVYGVLDLRDGRFEFVNCGHAPPFVLREAEGCVQLAVGGGPPLGLMPGQAFASTSVDLEPGDGLFLFTDGVTESIGPAGAEYGEHRLARALDAAAGAPATVIVQAVMEDVATFVAGEEPFDDITCLAVRLA
jgi:serine phosphatase RsbU (regulator of sigma subunit)